MKRIIALLVFAAGGLAAAPNALVDGRIAQVATRTPARHKVWLASLAVLAGGQFADAASSIGGWETNPMLRGADGHFNAGKGFMIKGAIVGGLIGGEYLVHKFSGHDADKAFVGINAGVGGLGLACAIHNSRIK